MPAERTEDQAPHGDKGERLTALFDSCYPRLARYAYARLGNAAEAEDIASEVFVRAFESLDSYRDRGTPMEAWLFRIARNMVIDRYRRSAQVERVCDDEGIEPASSDDPAGHAEQRVLMRDVRSALEQLTPEQREVITLRFFGELSSKEVGTVMNKRDGAVREMQRAALEKLRDLLRVEHLR